MADGGSTFNPPPRWKHQEQALDASIDRPYFMLAFEQRLGKSRVVLETALHHYAKDSIDAVVIVAMPSGVPVNWIRNEVPAFVPPSVPHRALAWDRDRHQTKEYQEQLNELLNFRGLAIFAVNGEAVIYESALRFLRRFFKQRWIMLVADESQLLMKTPNASRTKKLYAMSKQARVVVKRCLDGTPAGEGPFDLFAQYRFLDPSILGLTEFGSFKNHYAEMEIAQGRSGNTWPVVKRDDETGAPCYRNLDELSDRIAPHTFRVTRDQCFDLPQKIYQKVYVELSKEQRRVYDELCEKFVAELLTGHKVSGKIVLTRYLRLQQVTSNFVPPSRAALVCDDCGGQGCELCDELGVREAEVPGAVVDPTQDPRLDALGEVLIDLKDPVIVWARFHHDVDAIMDLGLRRGLHPVQYDGRMSAAAKVEALELFQAGKSGMLVGNQGAGGRGLKMSRARTIIYYSNVFSLTTRLQSEDRAEDVAAGMARAGTGVVDLIAQGTIDERIVEALRAKKRLADLITGDPRRDFI